MYWVLVARTFLACAFCNVFDAKNLNLFAILSREESSDIFCGIISPTFDISVRQRSLGSKLMFPRVREILKVSFLDK